MSFVAELKQRKVFRVATVYLVVAWVAIEASSIALPAFEAPDWTLRVVILLFALGFPLALLLTWVLELTPEGIRLATSKVGNKRMAVVVAAFTALALGWYFYGQPAFRHADAVAAERSIAVLPFVNMSGDPANEYFSDGLAETTLDMLAQVNDLKVVARTSSFAFKDTNADVREIGEKLDVAHLLEGSVQQAGDTVRITAQLVRTSDGSHVWSRRFDRKLADVFSIQDEIATEVVAALQVALPAAEQAHLLRRRTEDVAAYREYLKGIALLPGRRVADMRRAAAHFERAVTLDPQYARAHAAAATTYSLLQNYATISDEEVRRRDQHIQRALELAPDLGEAHVVQAAMLEKSWDLEGADRAYQRGIELAPGYATAYQWYAEFLLFQYGRIERALPYFQRAVALDPLSPIIRNEYAYAVALSGRTDEALRLVAELLEEHPGFAAAQALRAEIYEARGDLPAALRAWQAHDASDPAAVGKRAMRCRTLIRFGALAPARDCVEKAAREAPGQRDTVSARAMLAMLDKDYERSMAILRSGRPVNEWEVAHLQVATGQAEAAMPTLKRLMPTLFTQPEPALESGYPSDGLLVGAALIASGERDRGRELIRRQIAANADRPHDQMYFGRQWWDAMAYAVLEDGAASCQALRDAVAAGYFLDIDSLDTHPFMAPVRAQPCYASSLAPARQRAAAQVAAARAAGLL